MNERIKKLRKALDLTQQEFADKIGMKRNTVANYETDRNEPSNSVISLICKTFNVSETWLRTGEGEMFARRSEAEELSAAVERLVAGKSAEFKKRLVNALSTLKDEHWLLLEAKFGEIVGARDAAPAFAPAPPPGPPAPTIEEEARAEAQRHAELIYQQILSEKRAAAGLSSASSGPPAGGGTAKQT